MIKYVKEKSGIEKPVWVDPLFPAFRGLLDAVLRKVKVQSKSNQCAGGFIERTTREATLYEQAATTYLLKTLHPMSLELEAARKKSAAPMPEHQAETISTTEEARNARRAAEQQAQATAEKEAAEEKAAEMESSMLEMIDLTDNEVKEVLTKINIMQAMHGQAPASAFLRMPLVSGFIVFFLAGQPFSHFSLMLPSRLMWE